MSEIENVFIFVADGLRWDYAPDELCDDGVLFKTVAASLYSPPSFASLLTGLSPQQHGVHNWTNRLPDDVRRITDAEGYDGGFTDSKENDRLFKTLGFDSPTAVADLSTPFIAVERDQTTHYPYDAQGPADDYFRKGWEVIRAEYQDSVDTTLERFRRRLDELEERGIRDETLVVFTSDHGELLGEHGETLHVSPACPELVYVPTLFLHPSFDDESFRVAPGDEIVEHVDVVETAMSQLDDVDFETMGVDLTSTTRDRAWGYNHANVRRKNICFYRSDSAWWHDGGTAFVRNGKLGRLLYIAYKLFRSVSGPKFRRTPIKMMSNYVKDSYSYGTQPLSTAEINDQIDAFVATLDETDAQSVALDDETREQLREMGYLT